MDGGGAEVALPDLSVGATSEIAAAARALPTTSTRQVSGDFKETTNAASDIKAQPVKLAGGLEFITDRSAGLDMHTVASPQRPYINPCSPQSALKGDRFGSMSSTPSRKNARFQEHEVDFVTIPSRMESLAVGKQRSEMEVPRVGESVSDGDASCSVCLATTTVSSKRKDIASPASSSRSPDQALSHLNSVKTVFEAAHRKGVEVDETFHRVVEAVSPETSQLRLILIAVSLNKRFWYAILAWSLAYVVFVIFESNALVQDARQNLTEDAFAGYRFGEILFLLLFMMEMSVRIGGALVPIYRDMVLLFDMVVLILWLLDTILLRFEVTERGSIVGLALGTVSRLSRLLRIVRLTEELSFLRPVHLMLRGLKKSNGPSLVAIGLIVMYQLISALSMTMIVGPSSGIPRDELPEGTYRHFGQFSSCLLSFTETLLYGADWGTLYMRPFVGHSKFVLQTILFAFIVLVGYFGLMALVTGTFIEIMHTTAQEEAKTSDKERMWVGGDSENAQKKLKRLFDGMDADKDGKLTMKEFERGLAHVPEVCQQMGISIAQARVVFEKLDPKRTKNDTERKVNVDEFLHAIIKATMEADRTIDMIIVDYQQFRCGRDLAHLEHRMEIDSKRIEWEINRMGSLVDEISKECSNHPKALQDRYDRLGMALPQQPSIAISEFTGEFFPSAGNDPIIPQLSFPRTPPNPGTLLLSTRSTRSSPAEGGLTDGSEDESSTGLVLGAARRHILPLLSSWNTLLEEEGNRRFNNELQATLQRRRTNLRKGEVARGTAGASNSGDVAVRAPPGIGLSGTQVGIEAKLMAPKSDTRAESAAHGATHRASLGMALGRALRAAPAEAKVDFAQREAAEAIAAVELAEREKRRRERDQLAGKLLLQACQPKSEEWSKRPLQGSTGLIDPSLR